MSSVPQGLVLWEGRSLFDRQPIVGIVTGLVRPSENPKTGPMLQTWILRQNTHPAQAIRLGLDRSICGGCPLRGRVTRDADGYRNVGRACYVRVHQAPTQVWRCYRAGDYPRFNPAQHLDLFFGRSLRLGAYGDPTAIPLAAWLPILRVIHRHTGYTHAWREARFQEWTQWLMASCDNAAEASLARARGWNYFRVTPDWPEAREGEIVCPASDEAGKRTTCDHCGRCGGTRAPGRLDVVIRVHGVGQKAFTELQST
jgi:hypothetical protein